MNKSNIITAELIVIFISLYCFFRPTILTEIGYDYSLDGVVIARTFCLLFALYRFLKLIFFISTGDKNGSIR